MYNKKVRERIIENYGRIRELKLEQMKLMETLQNDCKHESVIEFCPEPGPWRKCVICLTEEGGPEFKILEKAHLKGPDHPMNRYDKLKPLKMVLVVDEDE